MKTTGVKLVLLVDDDEDLRLSVTMILADQGYLVTEAANSAEAIDEMRQQQFDAVITDLQMESNTSGLKVLEFALQHQSPMTALVLTTAAKHDLLVLAARWVRDNLVQFLPKPYEVADLLVTIERYNIKPAFRTAAMT